MSRLVLAVAVLAVAFSGGALARGGGGGGGGGHGGGGGGHGGGGGGHGGGGHFAGHFGGGGGGHVHIGGGHVAHASHFGAGRAAAHGSGRSSPHFRAAAVNSRNVKSTLNSLSHHGALRNARIVGNPTARAQLAAGAALAGRHGGSSGWWRHQNGGYGWVGPLFWPFAYYDIYDYTIWGDDAFWDYGYLDLYAGVFGPYGYDGLAGYGASPPPRRGQRFASSFAQMCADDGRDIAGLPIDQIAQAIGPSEAQRAALDDLGSASIKAAQIIRAGCPAQIAATAPGRLAVMQQRIEGMISAVELERPPLEKLYGLLDDEQKARFNALAENERKKAGGSAGPGCGTAQPASLAWPADEIETRLHPNDTQRAALKALQDAAERAADTLKTACQPTDVLTPTARLDAIAKRLEAMLAAVKSMRTALDDFYATLSDEQKAQFEAIGPKRTS